MTRHPGFLPAYDRLVTDRFAAEARQTKRHRLECLEKEPNCLNPAYPQKRLSVSPRGYPWGVLIDR